MPSMLVSTPMRLTSEKAIDGINMNRSFINVADGKYKIGNDRNRGDKEANAPCIDTL